MTLTYIGIACALTACAVMLAAFILFYKGFFIKTQKRLALVLFLCLAAIAAGIVLCYLGKFVLG